MPRPTVCVRYVEALDDDDLFNDYSVDINNRLDASATDQNNWSNLATTIAGLHLRAMANSLIVAG
jgi:hypothetical protein